MLQQGPQLDFTTNSGNSTDPHCRIYRNEANALYHDYHRSAASGAFAVERIGLATAVVRFCGVYIGVDSTRPADLSSQPHFRRPLLESKQYFAVMGLARHRDQNHERTIF